MRCLRFLTVVAACGVVVLGAQSCGDSPVVPGDDGVDIDDRPEHIGSVVTPGDTVTGEVIDVPGDVDEFYFTALAGQDFNLLFRASNGAPETVLVLEVLDVAGTVLRSVQSDGADTSLFQQITGRITIPVTGTQRIRVRGLTASSDRHTGAYRLFLYHIDHAPEIAQGTLALGDSILNEAIELPGDVDEFTVVVADSSGASLVLQPGGATGPGVLAAVLAAAGGQPLVEPSASAGSFAVSGTLRLDPGTYTVRVQGSDVDDRSLLRGAYRLWVHRLGFGPEAVGDTLAVGDTVDGEVIDPVGDVDEFFFRGAKWQHVNIAFQGAGTAETGALEAVVEGPDPVAGAPPFPLVVVSTPTAADSLGASQSNRIDLPGTGWYRVRVSSSAGPELRLGERGPYRFAVTNVGVGPEQVGDTVAPGDSVTTEAVDVPGDWDEFTLSATPGQLVALVASRSAGAAPPYHQLIVFDADSPDTVGWTVLEAREKKVVPRIMVPASGRLSVAVYEQRVVPASSTCADPTCGDVFRLLGDYRFAVHAIDPAPESVPAAFAVGDTVQGETLAPVTDIDEFAGTGVAGQRLMLEGRLDVDPDPAGGHISLRVVDPLTDAILVGEGFSLTGSSPDGSFTQVGSFEVPTGGTYVVRVESGSLDGANLATAPYRFFVRLEP